MRCKCCDAILPDYKLDEEEDMCLNCISASFSKTSILDKEYTFQEHETELSIYLLDLNTEKA